MFNKGCNTNVMIPNPFPSATAICRKLIEQTTLTWKILENLFVLCFVVSFIHINLTRLVHTGVEPRFKLLFDH